MSDMISRASRLGADKIIFTLNSEPDKSIASLIESCGGEWLVFENRGRNLLPFISGLRHLLKDSSPDFVGHYHSKKSAHNPKLGKIWNRKLMEIFESEVTVKRTLIAMQAKNCGVAYADVRSLISGRNMVWGQNYKFLGYLDKATGFSTPPVEERENIHFPAGGMFIISKKITEILSQSQIWAIDFPSENGAIDGMLHHGLERYLGTLVHNLHQNHLVLAGEGDLKIIRPPSLKP